MDTDSLAPSISSLGESLGHANIRDNDDSERLVIGLDFGTTYSGIAYAFTTKPDQIYTIQEWPGAKGRTSPKCPTLIKYDAPDSYRWGFELDRTTNERIEGIKLLLDPDQPKPLYVPPVNTEAELKKLGKPPIAVATDYMSAIFQHAIRKIESKYPKNYLDMLDKQFVLSVPAVWSDKAKDATLRAARNAGIAPVTLIKEPEAAALFTLHYMGNKGLEIGDALVLCDAGGGTVDLTSYEITKLHPLELKELVPGTGSLAGSLMLNRRFEEWVKDVVGERPYLELRESAPYRLAMKQFDENIKPGFRSRDDEEQYVNFPKANLKDDPSKGLKSDTITVTGQTLNTIFEPIFRDIDKLVAEQVMQVRLKRMKDKHPNGYDIKAIFLVGGFGSSVYLHESISNAHLDVQVIQPDDAWSAIVRGAVMSQLPSEAAVTSNVAPKHYGVSARAMFDPVRDAGETKHYDRYEDVYRVNTMTWYIQKGDDLIRARKIEFPFYRTWDANPSHELLQIEEELMECALDKAPDHPKPGVVTKNCTLKTDLSVVPMDSFKKKTRILENGEKLEYWQLYYKLLVTIQSGPMIFSILCGGKEYGQVAALLTLPRELRDHIWSLAFSNITVTPFASQSHEWFFYPARRQCHACPGVEASDVPSTRSIFRSVLACKQLYHEAYPILQGSMSLHISKPSELEDVRQSSRKNLKSNLKCMHLYVHLNESSREQWKHELCNLANTFPSLERLDIYNHMRPPVSFQNLSDVIYLAAPVVHFPPRMTPRLHFAYIEDDEMFTSEELGTIYYRDALDAHALVVRALMADPQFKDYSRNFNVESMINRLMRIAQSYEEPWLDSIRRRRRQEGSSAPT